MYVLNFPLLFYFQVSQGSLNKLAHGKTDYEISINIYCAKYVVNNKKNNTFAIRLLNYE